MEEMENEHKEEKEEIEEVEEENDETEESEEDQEDELENKEGLTMGRIVQPDKDIDTPVDESENHKDVSMSAQVPVAKACTTNHVDNHADSPTSEACLKSNMKTGNKSPVNDETGSLRPEIEDVNDVKSDAYNSVMCRSVDDDVIGSHAGVATPNTRSSALKVRHMKDEEVEHEAKVKERTEDGESRNPNNSFVFDTDTSGGGESGTEDEQAAFMNELERFYKERSLDFKPPKFYGEPLNLLKLWRAVMRLGGYDKVTACKFWRQVGESFKPPKTCTTVSWTFRIFYEKALLDYERHRTSGDDASLPTSLPQPVSVDNQASGSGRARRDAAARAMQGWHSQRILDNGEVSDPIIKDKTSITLHKREKQLKNLVGMKRQKPSPVDTAVKAARTKFSKTQSETTVIDIGSLADWVKINVRVTKDCYEVYALVPGLLREEVRVQSDPAGRLVISGEPENPDNPWCVTPFKKVVSLPTRIDPHQTSAVVTLHGQLFIRVPFEQYD